MTHTRQAGLSLVELMVGMLVSLFLAAGIIQVFSVNLQTDRLIGSSTKEHENIRLAIDVLTEQLRAAGFTGCISDPALRIYLLTDNEPRLAGSCTDAKCFPADMLDIETVTSAAGPRPYGLPDSPLRMPIGSTAVGFYRADPANCAATTSATLTKATSAIDLSTACNFGNDPYLLLASCSGLAIIQADGDDGTDGVNPLPLESGSSFAHLPFVFPEATDVFKLTGSLFYVACRSDADSDCALYYDDDIDDDRPPQELVQGIADLRVRYGVDTDNPPDGAADIFLYDLSTLSIAGVDNPWHRVVSLQVAFLSITPEDHLADSAVSYEFPPPTWSGTTRITPNDRRIRRVATTTVALRNRIANFRNNL